MLIKLDVTGLPIFDPALRAIPMYRKIIERDRGSKGDAEGRKKKQATKELAFVQLYTHFLLSNGEINTYYTKYDPDVRFEKLKNDLEMEEDWTIDEDLQVLIDHFQEQFVQDEDMDMLDGALFALRQTSQYFKSVDYTKRDTRLNLLYKPKEVMASLKELDGLLDKVEAIKERIKQKQKAATTKIRGGSEIGRRERPRDVR